MHLKEEIIRGCLEVNYEGLRDVKRCHLRCAREHGSSRRGHKGHDVTKLQLYQNCDGQDIREYQFKDDQRIQSS